MPWKGEKDPYKIWLSEIILQQTRVEQGLAYYEKFIRHYPTIRDLAAAPPDQVFKHWEGLGYYSRCKNLIYTAGLIVRDFNGRFPQNYDTVLSLKGIGPYTAAAICSFAYNQPFAVLDGNVFRVLARIFGIDTPIDSTSGKDQFQQLAERALSQAHPASYNQAIMDFGATVCKPAAPRCGSCPMNDICVARRTARIASLPRKEKTLQRKVRHISWLILEIRTTGHFYVQKRPGGDIWENLHEYYPIETAAHPEWTAERMEELVFNQLGVKASRIEKLAGATQQLTHQKINGYFYHIELSAKPHSLQQPQSQWLSREKISQLAFPKLLKDVQIKSIATGK